MKKYLCGFLFSIILLPISATYKITPIPVATTTKVVEASSVWDGYSELKHICSCESWGENDREPREYKDGQVLHGFPNPNDIGACQINTPIWGAQAQKLGDNLYTLDGNIAFAKWLYDKDGNKPWLWSKSCWKAY